MKGEARLRRRLLRAAIAFCRRGLPAVALATCLNCWGQQGVVIHATQRPQPAAPVQPSGDLIKFSDGSSLHGQLRSMDPEKGIQWHNPEATANIQFRPSRVHSIRLENAEGQPLKPTCRFLFRNGDDVYGDLISLQNERVELSSWFGHNAKVQRNALESVHFLSRNFSILCDGPASMDGWSVIHQSVNSWTYSDGAFSSSGPGFLSRRLNLTNSATLEFDLGWTSPLQFQINFYTDKEQVDHNSDSYVLTLTLKPIDSTIDCKRLQLGKPPVSLGEASLLVPTNQSQLHLTIHANRQEKAIAVYANGRPVKRWKDPDGFVGRGGNVVFYQVMGGYYFGQGASAPLLRLQNLKIAQWEGRFEPEGDIPTNTDVVVLLNHDKAGGKILGFKEGRVSLGIGVKTLEIPMERVKQLYFSNAPFPAPTSNPWQVRAQFPGGGTLCFDLRNWTAEQVSGHSAVFGEVSFQTKAIRQLQFNLNHLKNEAEPAKTEEFGGLDE